MWHTEVLSTINWFPCLCDTLKHCLKQTGCPAYVTHWTISYNQLVAQTMWHTEVFSTTNWFSCQCDTLENFLQQTGCPAYVTHWNMVSLPMQHTETLPTTNWLPCQYDTLKHCLQQTGCQPMWHRLHCLQQNSWLCYTWQFYHEYLICPVCHKSVLNRQNSTIN